MWERSITTNLAVGVIGAVKAVQEVFEDLLLCPITIHVFGMEADIVDPAVRERGRATHHVIISYKCAGLL